MVSADSLLSEESVVSEAVTDEASELLTDLKAHVGPLEASEELTERTVSLLRGKMLGWSLRGKTSCRAVQEAIEKLPKDMPEKDELLRELHQHAVELTKCPWGNYVAQKIIEVFPPESSGFVAQELLASPEGVFVLAKHPYGCRVMQRILERGVNSPVHQPLIQVIIEKTQELCRTQHGHHVANKVLERTTDIPGEVKTTVITAMCHRFGVICHSRNACDVLIKAMREGSAEDANLIADNVFENLLQMERLQDGKKSVDLLQAALAVQPQSETEMTKAPGLQMRLANKERARDLQRARNGR